MTGRAIPLRPAKRQRTETADYEKPVAASRAGKTQTLPANFNGDLNTLPDFNLNAQELPSSQIACLPATFTNSLLAYAAARDPYINSILAHQYDLQRARERARVINFSHYPQIACDMLDTELDGLSDDEVDQEASYIVSYIGKMFGNILKTVEKAGGYDCSYGTRKNAVEAMTKIMMYMATAPENAIGDKVSDEDYEAEKMEEKLLKMMDYFDGDELAQLNEEGWTDKVRELQGKWYSERLNEVVKMLEGDYEEEGEEGEEGEEDGEVE